MSNPELMDTLLHADPIEGLEIAWSSPDLSLAERARVISNLHMRSRMNLEGAARMTGATTAEIQAMLELATLDDEDLALVSDANPPATTWLLFASAESDAIRAGIAALVTGSDAFDKHTLVTVYEAMLEKSSPSQDDRIAAISADTLGNLSHKALEYGVLVPKSRSFLVSLARQKRNGRTALSEPQLRWLRSILEELVQTKVVTRNSPDGDQEMCDEVLNALGT